MRFRLILFPTLALSICASANAQIPKELKQKLFARYDGQNLNVMQPKILVTGLDGSGGTITDYSINYDHFYPAFIKSSWPKNYQKRNLLDEFTTEEVQSNARLTDPLIVGEMVRVKKFYAEMSKTGTLAIDFYIIALDGKRVARVQHTYEGEPGFVYKVDFGFHFRFIFPPSGPNVDETFAGITKEIDKYMIPTAEYQERNHSAADQAKAQQNISIEPGMSKEDVVKMMGEPIKSITFGKRTTLTYKEVTITLEENKVVDVKPN